jgi:hypothetical protein
MSAAHAQTWCTSHDEHRESVEDDVSLLMLRPALHMGFVSKHSAAVRHQQWLIVVDGRIQFHRKPSSRWQPYPRRSVPLGPHVVDAQWDAWSSILVLRVQRTLASSDAQGFLATYLPDCAFRFQNFNGQQVRERGALVCKTTWEDSETPPVPVALVCESGSVCVCVCVCDRERA